MSGSNGGSSSSPNWLIIALVAAVVVLGVAFANQSGFFSGFMGDDPVSRVKTDLTRVHRQREAGAIADAALSGTPYEDNKAANAEGDPPGTPATPAASNTVVNVTTTPAEPAVDASVSTTTTTSPAASPSKGAYCPQYRVTFSGTDAPPPDNFGSLMKGFEEFLAGEAIEGCRSTPPPSYWPQGTEVAGVGKKTCLDIPDFKMKGQVCYTISLRE